VKAELAPYLEAVEDEIRSIVSSGEPDLSPFYGMMLYHLGWLDARLLPFRAESGKRIRPLLCLLSNQAAGGDWRKAVPAAAALELLHSFSLLHDDIEDQSSTRRGRATVWKVWGLAHGVNSGDAMLMLAHTAMNRLSEHGVEPSVILNAISTFDRCALELCQGQYLDISTEGNLQLTEEAYLRTIGGKTAALIAASTELGAMLAGAAVEREHYRSFGRNLGLAFQMVDDLLGIWGDPALTGKPADDDMRCRKMTLPVIPGLKSPVVGAELKALYRRPLWTEMEIARAVELVDASGSRNYVQSIASEYQARAEMALQQASPRQPAAALLRKLSDSLTARSQ
jgi:geranylgeranyl diphosphate synthase type I